jgi:hypothetical protein
VAPTYYIVRGQVEKIPEAAVGLVRDCIAVLDGIEAKLVEAQTYFVATRVDSININDEHATKLRAERALWAKTLYDLLGAPINIYAAMFLNGSAQPMNISIQPV